MTTTRRPPSGRQVTRQVVRELKHSRATAKLPLTFLGNYGEHIPVPEQGWQSRMWTHHAFATGAVFAAGIAVNSAVEHGVLPDPTWVSAGSVLLGALSSAAGLLTTAGEKFTDWARAYFTVTPAAAGIYLAAVAHVSPWSTGSLLSAAAGCLVGMGAYYQMRTRQDEHELAYVSRFASVTAPAQRRAPEAPMPAAPVADELDPDARRWNHALETVGLKGCRFIRRKETPAGYAVLVGLDRTGKIAPKAVGDKLGALERNMGMLADCLEWDVAVNSDGRQLSDRVWIIVDVEDILSQILEMPDDETAHSPTSIREAFRIGTFMDGTPMTLRFREICALIVGVRGRGKTNLFHVLVHQLSRCIDVVLWAIDLKGGRAVKPWIRPWLEERAERPIFDWVATTRAEATLMVYAAHELIKFRGNASRGGSKIEPSAQHPAVLVLVDEFAALAGKHVGPTSRNRAADWWKNPSAGQVAGIVTSCLQLGRSESVDFIMCTQRSTVTMTGGGDLKSQCEMRIGLGVTSPADAQSVFQNNNVAAKKLAKLKDQRTRGSCLIENGLDPNHLAGKVYFYGDDDAMLRRIDRTATLHAMYPADLALLEQRAIDEALLTLTEGECGYGVGPDAAADQRWSMDRAAHLFTEGLPDDWDDDPEDDDVLRGEPTSGAATGTATRTRTARPASAPPAARQTSAPPARPGPNPPTYQRGVIPTSPGHPPVTDPPAAGPPVGDPRRGFDGTGRRYYVPRAERQPTEPAPTPPGDDGMDPESRGYQDDFDRLVEYLASSPEATEPVYDNTDPDQQDRYQLMLDIVREAGKAGIMPGQITKEMVHRGRGWAKPNQIYPFLKRAARAGLIRQPWERAPYYWHENAPGRTA